MLEINFQTSSFQQSLCFYGQFNNQTLNSEIVRQIWKLIILCLQIKYKDLDYTRQQEEMVLGIVKFAQIMSLLAVLTNCIQIPALSKQKLHHIQYVPDNIHRFIFLNEYVHDQLKSSLPLGENIEYFTHICSKDVALLSVCNEKQNTPIMLAYNKMIFSYEVHRTPLSNEALADDVSAWINLVLSKNHKKNLKENEILEILKKNNQLVLIIENATMRQFQSAAQILSKEFTYIDVIYLSDTPNSDKYGLEIGDIIHIKNLEPQDYQIGDLATIIKNNTLTTLLIRQAPKRYDIMKLFVLQNIFTRGFAKETEGLERKRFQIKVRSADKKIEEQQQRTVLVNCDLSSDCVKFWKVLDSQLWSSKNQIDSTTIFRRLLFRFQIRKNIQVLEIYYHLKLRNKNIPYVLVLDGQDPQVPNLPIRYLKQLSLESNDPLGQINQFLNQIDAGRVQKVWMTSGIPKRNGFTGKGSQKFIQKLSYQTYKKVLKETRDKQEYYFLYVTANEFECSQCKQFYNQLKKLAAFLHSENQMKVTFGVYDLSKDQIDFKYLESIPSVLLFTPEEDRPVQYKNRYEFEHVLNFLKKQIEKSQNKRNKRDEQPIRQHIEEPQL